MKKKLLTLALAMSGFVSTESFAQASLNFDGSNDQVDIGNSLNSVLDPLNNFTVEAWVNPASSNGLGVIVGSYNSNANNGQMQFLLRRENAAYTFWVDDGTGFKQVISSASSVTVGSWQHVAGVWDGSEIRIYINGQLENTTSGVTGSDFATTSNPIVFGYNSINERFLGSIDESRIWSTARTATEISDNMNCSVTPDQTGILAAYNFNDGLADGTNSGITTVYDYTNSGYNGTMSGFALTGTTSNFTTDARMNYLSMDGAVGSTNISERHYAPTVGDFNNDGHQDFMAVVENTDLRIYLNDGAGNFSAYTTLAQSSFLKSIAVDIDNDGDDDIITKINVNPHATVFINDGSGNYTDLGVSLLNGDGNVSVIQTADVNGDNKIDIIIGNDNGGAVDQTEVWLNTGTTGNASFAFSAGLANTGGAANSIAIGDVDGDNDNDIIIGSSSWNAKYYLNDNNSGTWTAQTDIGGYCGGVQLIDWDQNGTLDLVNVDGYNNWGARVRFNDGNGNFDATTTTIIAGFTGFGGECEFKDINGDGFLDVVSTMWGGYGKVYLNNGCVLTEQTDCSYRLGRADNGVELGDFDGNGKLDIICVARDNKSTIAFNYLDNVTTPALPVITAITGATICDGETATISMTATGATDYTWYTNVAQSNQAGTGASLTTGVLSAGTTTYYAEVENANGCKTTSSHPVDIVVNENPAVALASSAVTTLDCNGDTDGELQIDVTLNGSATSSTFDWDNDGTGDNDDTEDLLNVVAGTYNLVLIDNNNCEATLQATVTEPTAISISGSTIDLDCNGDTDGEVNINVTGGTVATDYSYDWNSGAHTTADITGLIGGSYNLTVTDDNNCAETSSFTINEPDAVAVSESIIDVDCNGNSTGEIDITVTGGTIATDYSYDWNSGAFSTEDLTGLAAGSYNVVVTDDNNCTGSGSYTVNEPTAISGSATSTDEINGNDGSIDLTVSGGTSAYTYSWTGPNGFTSTDEDPTGLEAGTYDVTVTDNNGCTFMTQAVVGSQVGLDENAKISLKLYPNPTQGTFFVDAQSNIDMIHILDASGKVLLTKEVNNSNFEMDMNTMENGVYFIKLQSNESIQTIRLVLNK